jgi:MFS family permease
VLVALAVPVVVRADRARGERRVDLPGALLVTLATALLIYGLVNAGGDDGAGGWTAAGTLVPVLAAAAAYGVFVLVESKVAAPLMRPATMARRPVVSGTFLMLVATGLMLGLFFLTSLYFQHVRGFGALKTGLLFLPVAVAITIGALLGSHLIGKIGGRPIAVVSFLLTAGGAGLLSQLSAGGSVYTEVLPGFLLAALGIGPVFVTATTTTLANVPHAEAGVASGVINTFHELGGSIGVAVVSTVAAASIASTSDSGGDIGGFADAYLVCGVTAVVAAVVAAVLVPAGRPRAVAGHGHGH